MRADAACGYSVQKEEEPVFPGIIGFSDQYRCYDETVIEFVV